MNMIEIYGMDGKVKQLINGDKILGASPMALNGKDCVQIELLAGDYVHSYETLENFRKRTGQQWVELKCGENPIKVQKKEIVAYKLLAGKLYFWLAGNPDSFLCTEYIKSFEEKLGINKEEEK